MTAPIHHTSRPRHTAGHEAGDPIRGAARGGSGVLGGKRGVLQQVWRQLPFFVWLIALWMLLWGQFTVLAFVTGLIAAVAVTRVFRLPPVELSGRVNIWYGAIFVVSFLWAVVRGSLTVAAQVLDFRHQPGTAIIAVPVRIDDDLIMTHTAITASLIPGSLIVDADRDRRILYLHVIGVRNAEDVEAQRQAVLGWERRIVMAVGSRAQVAAVASRAGTSGAAAATDTGSGGAP
ncbi:MULTISPECIES: Na+/H+ antiporter subunit E [unclassified Microbacterium]|uniref:Na+/H+ antiporter subunit E n=1 Tax=unclassified Microbacterium TaxID=2609290 RepID=UPI00214CFEBD|nr:MULTISPECIES: Na+/H+ antiporter subunit E [unclassified Microbacterium]MCR2808269.1 Na+/H+ antiporter subunit E [Microbacterium sp. zg.B185]WIM19276.1 Na+/H+ antiporter subunit E [Microbacterium sp. zg-B185]